ncbi:hypothetical protein ART_1107 [Arthrobacter sp. PAMC 25486]|uniref:hypothetical protein n=1 Tax=Arthrobacter sp. PAMC 25486 TaxID=1494608 RepID=UPI0005360B22|nr:hypothetical protein [Arthrobacter sp. PAMC 25486]AIY00706.1 hypothetical protein ART_1107 [Arthrobacter sp. PAMC 25486]
MKVGPRGTQLPPGRKEGIIMGNLTASGSPHTTAAEGEAGSPREHSETAVEGNDGLDMPEIRMHSQAAAEGPDDD